MNKTLTLPLKAKWYEMIEQGIKTEEYREIKPYWITRLCSSMCYECSRSFFEELYRDNLTQNEIEEGLSNPDISSFYGYDSVRFSYGYTKRNMTFRCEGKPEWGAEPEKKYFVIKLGERIK